MTPATLCPLLAKGVEQPFREKETSSPVSLGDSFRLFSSSLYPDSLLRTRLQLSACQLGDSLHARRLQI